jgi:hypothetical protein
MGRTFVSRLFQGRHAPQPPALQARRLVGWLVARVVVTDEEIEILDVHSPLFSVRRAEGRDVRSRGVGQRR